MEPTLHQIRPELESFPEDVTLAITSFLSHRDLCSLASCSRFWNRLCASNFIWDSLSARRWPSIEESPFLSTIQEGKSDYIRRHQEMALRFSDIVTFVDQRSKNESLEVTDFLKAVSLLNSSHASFMDVKLFMLTSDHNVLLNLIGLHYAIFFLRVPVGRVLEALKSSGLSGRRVKVQWFKLGRWYFDSRLPDESRCRNITLLELVTSEEEVRNVLNRGILHEVLRVQVTALVS